MHEKIFNFGIEGMLDDSSMPRLRSEFERLVTQDMAEEGYVPVLDLGTHWTTEYVEENDTYNFQLTVYGVQVGREIACTTEGISGGRLIPRGTPQNKLPPSSESAE